MHLSSTGIRHGTAEDKRGSGGLRPQTKTTHDMTRKEIIARVASGARLQVDFKRRTFSLNGKEYTATETGPSETEDEDPLTETERLYAIFKRSVPSERSDRRRKEYFKALTADQLDNEDLMFGTGREEARAELELHLLHCIASGRLTWDEQTFGRWFWRSKKDPDLVILREWMEPAHAPQARK